MWANYEFPTWHFGRLIWQEFKWFHERSRILKYSASKLINHTLITQRRVASVVVVADDDIRRAALMADSGSLIIRFAARAINSRSILIQTVIIMWSRRAIVYSRMVDMFSRPIRQAAMKESELGCLPMQMLFESSDWEMKCEKWPQLSTGFCDDDCEDQWRD